MAHRGLEEVGPKAARADLQVRRISLVGLLFGRGEVLLG